MTSVVYANLDDEMKERGCLSASDRAACIATAEGDLIDAEMARLNPDLDVSVLFRSGSAAG